jgi:tight adherence protein B
VFAGLLMAAAVMVALAPAGERRLLRLTGIDRGAGVAHLGALLRRLAGRVGVGPASRRRQARDRTRVIQALGSLAAELEAGLPPEEALMRSAAQHAASPQSAPPWSAWPQAAAAARWGGDVPAALDLDAESRPVLAQVAACWRVGAQGAGLAASVRQVAVTARAAEDVRVEVEGQLAGPRATGRMLALLPLVGLALGTMLGSDPLAWLTTTLPGRLCLLGGVLLTVTGAWWTGRIAASVERRL